jgi:sodium-dependent dicarboxylate transporter 2/3/5
MTAQRVGLVLGISLFILILTLPTFSAFESTAAHILETHHAPIEASELARSMQVVLALLALMVCCWLTEAIPLPATALLPAAVLPLLHISGVHGSAVHEFTPRNVLANYANPVIYLFFGGFLLAAAMQKWKLDRRFTLWLLTRGNLANDSAYVLLGLMVVTAFLSMWISNTAATAMMLPLGFGVLSLLNAEPGKSKFGTALMLGIAWAASIGGVGTIIGTPPNGIVLGILNTTFADDPTYQRITFLDWMLFGIPYVLCFLPVVWLLLLKLYPPEVKKLPGGKERLVEERNQLGSMSAGERRTLAVFVLGVTLWVSNPFWPSLLPESISTQLEWVDEFSIGLLLGVAMFFVPVDVRKHGFILDWSDTRFVDWGTLLLFGGGIALSDAMFKTGLAQWIATSFVGFFGPPSTLVMMFIVILLVDFLTEITSNTAVTSMMVPVVISVAIQTGENPVTIAIAAALAASMAFMLPVATPPNALVYATGYVRLRDMIRAGLVLDVVGWMVTVGVIVVFGGWLFGVLEF